MGHVYDVCLQSTSVELVSPWSVSMEHSHGACQWCASTVHTCSACLWCSSAEHIQGRVHGACPRGTSLELRPILFIFQGGSLGVQAYSLSPISLRGARVSELRSSAVWHKECGFLNHGVPIITLEHPRYQLSILDPQNLSEPPFPPVHYELTAISTHHTAHRVGTYVVYNPLPPSPLCPREQNVFSPQGLCSCCSYCLICCTKKGS